MNLAQLVRLQVRLLEQLFERATLVDQRRNHPAGRRYHLCLEILRQGGVVHWPDQRGASPEFARMLLDAMAFISLSNGDLQEFRLGDLAGYGDAKVQAKIRSRFNDKGQFEDLMIELSIAAWHQMKGHLVTPTEAPGLADLRIDGATPDLPILVECKRLNTTNPARIRKDITEANRQIKAWGIDAYGIVVIDVSAALPLQQSLTDDLPVEIEPIVSVIEAALRGPKNRAVSRVIAFWDEYGTKGEPPDNSMIHLRRRVLCFEHSTQSGVHLLPPNAETYQGNTVLSSLKWDQSSEGIDRITPSDPMKECQECFDISDEDLISSFTRREKWQSLTTKAGTTISLFSAESEWKGRRTLIIAHASRAQSVLHVHFALRLPERILQLTKLLTPIESLELVASEYGLDFMAGGYLGRFLQSARFAICSTGGSSDLVVVRNPRGHEVLQVMTVEIEEAGFSTIAHCVLVFALDRTLLLAELAA